MPYNTVRTLHLSAGSALIYTESMTDAEAQHEIFVAMKECISTQEPVTFNVPSHLTG